MTSYARDEKLILDRSSLKGAVRQQNGVGLEKLNWIRELVLAEKQMEDAGVVDFTAGFDPQQQLEEATLEYLADLKAAFLEAASAFNQLKGSHLGQLKIYGISKTRADFMLFRNGHKLIFSMRQPGQIMVSYNTMGSNFLPGQTAAPDQARYDLIAAHWRAFGELRWMYNDQDVNMDYLVRFYTSRFVRESAK